MLQLVKLKFLLIAAAIVVAMAYAMVREHHRYAVMHEIDMNNVKQQMDHPASVDWWKH